MKSHAPFFLGKLSIKASSVLFGLRLRLLLWLPLLLRSSLGSGLWSRFCRAGRNWGAFFASGTDGGRREEKFIGYYRQKENTDCQTDGKFLEKIRCAACAEHTGNLPGNTTHACAQA